VTRESGFDSQREEIFLSSRPSKPVLVFTQAPVQYVLGLKRPEPEADNTLNLVPLLRVRVGHTY